MVSGVREGRGVTYPLLNVCESYDLLERARNARLATRDEDAGGDDGVLRLALEQLLLVDALEELLARIGDTLRQANHVAHVANLPVRRAQVPPSSARVLGQTRRRLLQRSCGARVTVFEGDNGGEDRKSVV